MPFCFSIELVWLAGGGGREGREGWVGEQKGNVRFCLSGPRISCFRFYRPLAVYFWKTNKTWFATANVAILGFATFHGAIHDVVFVLNICYF